MEIVSQEANRSLGRHILAEFWGGCHLASPLLLEEALKVAAIKAGATILGSFAHHFGEEQGVTSNGQDLYLEQEHLTEVYAH
jgi:S-adenosylmethionine/arginine decarboxylase-like enzyme